MTPRFDGATEARLREEFLAGRPAYERHALRPACAIFCEVFPGDSILNHTHTIEWVREWNARQRSPHTRKNHLRVLGAWWDWLFERGLLDNNVLDFVCYRELAADAAPPLTLRCNLQRHVVEHLRKFPARSAESYRVWLKRFNLFINRLPTVPRWKEGKLDIGERILVAWFRQFDGCYAGSTFRTSCTTLSAFFDALVEKGVLIENRLERLRRQFPLRGRTSVARALGSSDRRAALCVLARPPMFGSELAEHLSGFLALKHATGCRYPHAPTALRDFDRFLVVRRERGPITFDMLARWRDSRPDLKPSTHVIRFAVMRRFCLYLRRYVRDTYVPDLLVTRVQQPRFKARIVAPREMRMLLDAIATVVPGTCFALRRDVHRTLYTLLYTTGLRIGEALRLQVRDVDLLGRVITIRQTKFYKSRLVPFSDGLLPVLRDYHRERIRLLGPPAPEAPFFVSQRGGPVAHNAIAGVWRALRCHTGLGGYGIGNGPRIHDLRHSFATLRLAAWYRDGADVQAKLPLLSTYLGHVDIATTQRYLTILPETKLAASERFRRYGGALVGGAGGARARA